MSIEKTKLQKLLDGEVVIYLDSKEEYEECSKIIGKKITTRYYGRYCYNVPEYTFSSSSSKINSGGYNLPIIYLIDIQEKQFVLPERWCVKAKNEEEDKILIKWRGGGHSDEIGKSFMHYYRFWSPEQLGNTEITFEQFKQYVLKESKEDYQNVLDIGVGDVVRCTSKHNSKFSEVKGSGWEPNFEFVVTSVINNDTNNCVSKIYFGGKDNNGVYSDTVRLVKKNSNKRNLIPGKIYTHIFDGDVYLDKFDSMIDGEYYFSKGISISNEKWNIYSEAECLSEDNLPKEIELASEKQTKWFEACEKANAYISFENFIKPKFEVGKWYSFDWHIISNINKQVICKIKEIKSDCIIISWRKYLYDNSFSISDGYYIEKISNIKELSLDEIQQYLPDGHPDKVKSVEEYSVGTYLVSYVDKLFFIIGDILRIEPNNGAYSFRLNKQITVTDPKSAYKHSLKWFATKQEAEEYSKHLLFENYVNIEQFTFKPSTKEAYDAQLSKQTTNGVPKYISSIKNNPSLPSDCKKSELILNISDEDIPMSSIPIQKIKTIRLLTI